MVFGFGTAMLVERGRGLMEASAATSLALWLVVVSVPLGGAIADRTGRRDATLIAGLVIFAIALSAAGFGASGLSIFFALGMVGGLAAGPIMSLPAAILGPETRAQGMGLFWTLHYVCSFGGPAVGGAIAAVAGSASAAFLFGAGLLLVCLALLGVFRASNAVLARAV